MFYATGMTLSLGSLGVMTTFTLYDKGDIVIEGIHAFQVIQGLPGV